jgi:hypothetical protein
MLSFVRARKKSPRASADAVEHPVTAVLEPGETVLWAGRPHPIRLVRSRTVLAMLGTVMMAMLIMMPASRLVFPAEKPGAVFRSVPHRIANGGIFVLGACSLAAFFLAYRRAGRTVYVLTDRRVLGVNGGRLAFGALLTEIETAVVRPFDTESGDILFFRSCAAVTSSPHTFSEGFLGIVNVEQIHVSLLRARQVLMKEREDSTVPDYVDFLIQGKRAGDLSVR